MRILLKGEIGIGKTSICKKVVDELKFQRYSVFGVLTFPIIRAGRRAGFYLINIKNGEREILAGEKGYDGPRIGRYFFNPTGIEFGIRALSEIGDIGVADEIGKLEIEGKGFRNAIPKIRERENLIVTARSKFAEKVKILFDLNFKTYEITLDNRNSLADIIAENITF